MLPAEVTAVDGDLRRQPLLQDVDLSSGTVVLDNNTTSDLGYSANTLYCLNETSRAKRDVTEGAYAAYEKFKTRMGWWATLGFFLVTMSLFLMLKPRLLRTFDRVIGYKPPETK